MTDPSFVAEPHVEVTYTPGPTIEITAPGPQGAAGVGVIFMAPDEEPIPGVTPAPSLIVQPVN